MASIKRKGSVVRVQFRPEERLILAGLAGEVMQLLAAEESDADPLAAMVGMSDEAVAAPDDPAVHRLLPDAYDDPEGAAEFRRLTDAELRRGKSDRLSRLVDALSAEGQPIELSSDEADGWLSAINDIRLVLGVRLDVSDDFGDWRSSLAPDDARLPLVAAYDWLSMVQEMLVEAVL
ncbi:MAG TPA: DUF2017 domain-containing protein [Mycobacteriales bacterium]|nr:DUF2017 domain-containing protein [Mycobacteriales bacterium]